jgi:hypothetical protein
MCLHALAIFKKALAHGIITPEYRSKQFITETMQNSNFSYHDASYFMISTLDALKTKQNKTPTWQTQATRMILK